MSLTTKLAIIAIVAATPFALAASASAKPIDPGFGKGPKFAPKPFPYPKPWPKPGWHPHYHHSRVIIVAPRPIISQPVYSQPSVRTVTRVVSQPAPQQQTTNCLTKEYSPDGIVTFKDLCTKETASAVLPGSPAAMQQQQQQGAPQVAPQGAIQGTQGVAPVTQNQTLNTTAQQMSAAQPK